MSDQGHVEFFWFIYYIFHLTQYLVTIVDFSFKTQ